MADEIGAEILVVGTCDEHHRGVQLRKLFRFDAHILLVKVGEQPAGPGPDCGQRVGLLGAAEELRQDRRRCDAVGWHVIATGESPAGFVEEPQSLSGVGDHGVGELDEVRIGEQSDHLG